MSYSEIEPGRFKKPGRFKRRMNMVTKNKLTQIAKTLPVMSVDEGRGEVFNREGFELAVRNILAGSGLVASDEGIAEAVEIGRRKFDRVQRRR
jgi:hypothetical protein